ncbi:MAG: biosynthetic-type acetolactate synthase large subunit [Sphaerochaetaceae bacterium]|nr:biosynthetic-type acetolactate synthase large subunit [Sphaerochaetaceae bacterium]MDC7236487.1 biosynthetic-type acetolactate synthase large subunit [Sphaerochaetaceae bacterium]MDC7243552.1 biosynthetic-type acetolactate synthase large subunit [Sphaerochaetaceae bacterium]MDC7250308.1 biosynthetic-type acetolactate synthase large subunit [Sphaerochaetaceae bacterium]
MELTGAKIIVECLIEQNVDTVFGYPGGAVLPLYDALYDKSDKITHVLTAHEQGASHAADGYARSTGKVGICIATSGPGATNLVTGIATAQMDSVPLVAITGNVPVTLLGKDSFQEVDISGITMPITKHNYIVKDVKDLANIMREAFEIAVSGRPGPVLIDIPKDVQTSVCEYKAATPCEKELVFDRLSDESLEEAVRLLKESENPMCYVGGGVIISDASEKVRTFLDLIDAPSCVSLMGCGAIRSDSHRYTGLVGMHGSKVSNVCVNNCDLLIVIGARFSDRVVSKASSFAKNAKIIQIDVDPAEIDKNIATTCHLLGDINVVLEKLCDKIKKPLVHDEWMETVAQYKRRFPLLTNQESQRASEVIHALNDILGENDIVTTEVGQHQIWSAQFVDHKNPRRFLTSGGLGTMGYGTGASIGAQMGNKNSRVVNIAGDGCFRMNSNELTTISKYNLPIVIIVMNNHTLGMVRQWQTLFYKGHYSQTTLDTPIDWLLLAKAYGVEGRRISPGDDAKKILEEAFELKKPVVIDVEIPLDDKVFPIVPPGNSIKDMQGVVEIDLI